jgi:hypothetical protein
LIYQPNKSFGRPGEARQRGTVCHSACAAIGTETPLLATERNQFFFVARITPDPQESMVKPSALEILVKLIDNVGRQDAERENPVRRQALRSLTRRLLRYSTARRRCVAVTTFLDQLLQGGFVELSLGK